MDSTDRFVAFDGMVQFATGTMAEIRNTVCSRLEASPTASILVFDQVTGRQTDIELRRTSENEVSAPSSNGPGRPRLGVVGREVTLLPRHWEWLSSQPGGASVALRKLVDAARKQNAENDDLRRRHEAAYNFMSSIAGNLAGYEEALRSLFADDRAGVTKLTHDWPSDVRHFALQLAFPQCDPAESHRSSELN